MAKGVPHFLKDGKEYKGQMHKMSDGSLHTGKTHNSKSVALFHLNALKGAAQKKAIAGGLAKNIMANRSKFK